MNITFWKQRLQLVLTLILESENEQVIDAEHKIEEEED